MTHHRRTTERPQARFAELDLLIALCRTAVDSRAVMAALARDPDPDAFVALARRHRVVPIVARNLGEAHGGLPEPAAESLRADARRNGLNALRCALHTARLVTGLKKAGIAALPLKGVCLARQYYGDVTARHVGDVDILVEPGDLEAADRMLRATGHVLLAGKAPAPPGAPVRLSRYEHTLLYFSDDRITVELHRQLHPNPQLLPLSVPEVVAGGVTVSLGGVDLPTLSDEQQLLYLATHGARHDWVRLQWICDIAAMVERAKPGVVEGWVDAARRHSLVAPVVQSLVLAHEFLGSALPASVERMWRGSARIGYMVTRAKGALLRPDDRAGEVSADTGTSFVRYRFSMKGTPAYLWHEANYCIREQSARWLQAPAGAPPGTDGGRKQPE